MDRDTSGATAGDSARGGREETGGCCAGSVAFFSSSERVAHAVHAAMQWRSQVQVTLTSRGDSVPFVGGDVVLRRDGARLWWWCYGRLCLAFLPRSTNRDDPPPRCSPLSGLPCPFLSLPFPSLPASFSLSLFLFPFFSSFHPALADNDGHGHGEFRVAVSRQRNTSSCYSSHTLQDVPYVRRDTSVCFCPATAKSRVSCVTLNYPAAVRL